MTPTRPAKAGPRRCGTPAAYSVVFSALSASLLALREIVFIRVYPCSSVARALSSARAADVVSLRISEPVARRPIGIAWVKDRYLPAGARLFRDFATAARPASRR